MTLRSVREATEPHGVEKSDEMSLMSDSKDNPLTNDLRGGSVPNIGAGGYKQRGGVDDISVSLSSLRYKYSSIRRLLEPDASTK